ncbi:MAG TPA: hypothetical protein VKQ11_00355 [Candidatus Sulfotelmatobacter sp.]|nr:hypothetical protein [Candidatus Sulfotelmatobacter sp.]
MRTIVISILLFSALFAQTKDSDQRLLNSKTFANLGTPANGAIVYCSDCTAANPTASGGTGAVVRRENGAWNGGGGSGGVSSFTGDGTLITNSASTGAVTATLGKTFQGNGTKLQLSTGTTTTGDCVKFDANGNTIDSGGACGGGGSPGGSTTQFQFNDASSFNGTAGFTWDKNNPGLSLSLINPLQGNDANDRRGARFAFTTDSSTSNPNFSDQNGLEIVQTILNGQATNGGATTAKTTFLTLNLSQTGYGSGQRIPFGIGQISYGMSDSGLMSITNQYAGGPVNGDECDGCFSTVSYSKQQPSLALTTISSVVTPSTCNTTSTQSITANIAVQTVTVASSTGCNIGNYVIIGQEVASGSPNLEAVKITASAAGSISGIFRYTHSNGVTVTPATVLAVADVSKFGQDRVLVDMSATSYTTGTVASISGGGFTGSGTTWANNMVGGTATNIGCVSLTNDNFTVTPFDNGANILRSWYQITSVTSATSIGIFTYSVAGDMAYRGNGVGSGAYTIRPCARVLLIESSAGSFTGNVILENNSFTWTAADNIEVAISPYPDVTGFQYNIAAWTPGGTYRQFMNVTNSGARKFSGGFNLVSALAVGGGADTVAWDTGYAVDSANTGFSIGETRTGNAFLATATPTNSTTKKPCYNFVGAALAGGVCADYDTALVGLTGQSTDNLSTGGFAKVTVDYVNNPDGKGIITAVGHFTIDGSRAGSNGPLVTIKSASNDTLQFAMNAGSTTDTGRGGTIEEVVNYHHASDPFVSYGSMIETGVQMNDGANNTAFGSFGATKIAASSSPATNASSNLIWYNASVWTGSVARNTWMFNRAYPGVSGNNAHVEWQVAGLDPAQTWNATFPSVFAGVNDQGKFRFGNENLPQASSVMATLDPTGLTASRLFTMPDMAGTFALDLTGTTGTISGAVTAGVCDSGTATVTGATTGMGVVATPITYPGDGTVWYGYVSGSNTVTVKVCGLTVVTPSASAYNVRVIK